MFVLRCVVNGTMQVTHLNTMSHKKHATLFPRFLVDFYTSCSSGNRNEYSTNDLKITTLP